MKPVDLPLALARKGEIIKHNREQRERLAQLQVEIARSQSDQTPVDDQVESIVGAAAAVGAGDNTAHYRGVQPGVLLEPLRSEFSGGRTAIQFSGQPDPHLPA